MRFFAKCTCTLFVMFALFSSCKQKEKLFLAIPSEHSGIHFNNSIPDNDSFNIIKFQNVYNGGGVGIGDFNNDGLQDIYFTGNMVSNKLYLNKGGFSFLDITEEAGVDGQGEWCRGVAVVDINNDGWMDIYVCATMKKDPEKRRNLLYINQGADKNGIPHFKEMAAEYGLNDTTHSTMAAFFDYDNDGDLDMYLTVNEIRPGENPDLFRPIVKDGSAPSTGRLYRNDWSDSLKHPVFTNVSKQAGITIEGYGHDVTIADINQDGWKDIYVSNDFISNDLLYINNHDGTFSEKSQTYFKHTAANGMGQDIEDINNDGLADIVELDMSPEDNFRKKMNMSGERYLNYQNSDQFGYTYQYVRNNLQLNLGPRINKNDSVGDPVFADIGFYSGISETDWSWTPMVTDFDNDGFRDIIITNGFPKDVTDHDFIAFRDMASRLLSTKEMLKQIPEVKLHKYAYRNNGDLSFSDMSKEWGFTATTFSNGAAYADLDNDGAIDLVINNINDEASVYRNTSMDNKKGNNHYLNIQFAGDSLNRNGLGAIAELHYGQGKIQVYENTPYRGYLSTIQNIAHFGLGKTQTVDSVLIKWPNGKLQLLLQVPTDQLLKVNVKNAAVPYTFSKPVLNENAVFSDITDSTGIHYRHEERDYIDFNIQKLLPHKFTQYGPSIAVGDIDGNGLDDMIVGGSAYHSAQIFLQQPDGRFIQKALLPDSIAMNKQADDEGILLFDADGDGDLDLFIAAGGYQYESENAAYQDRLYSNDGKGNFTLETAALPKNLTSKFCVRAADYDHDGDLDLFISGRVDPRNYPKPVSSFIYRNDSKNGHIKFTDVTPTVAKDLTKIGMVCDAIWTDFDNDGWQDLILAGEWMPVTFLKNDKGVFKNVTDISGIQDQTGWWNSITAGDFDNDGKMDYIIGNLGQNSFYRASEQYPARVYGGDFDNNGIYDMIPSLYLPDINGEKKEFPAQTRDDLLRQINAIRRNFPTYKSFATATMDQVLTDAQRKQALILNANNFKTSMIHNDGNGKFSMSAMPAMTQFSAINGMTVEDFDGDGNLDVVMNTNDFGTEVSVGRYDALNGLYIKGDGKGNFSPESILQSGIYIPGNGKALVKLKSANGNYLLAASQNRGSLKVYKLRVATRTLPLKASDVSILIHYKDGRSRKQEAYYGDSFLSQSARFLKLDGQMKLVEISDAQGNKRNISIQ
jgi:ASPIC and UnbV/FG-GAP-like repeat